MISYGRALEIIESLPRSSDTISVRLERSLGRILSTDLVARIPSPPFSNSAMDGYVCRWEELVKGPLRVTGLLRAQAIPALSVSDDRESGTCLRITTGSPIPTWADTVVPHEGVNVLRTGSIELNSRLTLGDNIRRAGEDLAEGDRILAAGTLLDPERIMLAAAFGYESLPTVQPPRIVIATSGDVIVSPGSPLPVGGIFNSNLYFLQAALEKLGLSCADKPIHLSDHLGTAVSRFEELLGPDDEPTLVITTGAVSAGDADFIPELVGTMGFEILFHKVAVRPGKPVMLAKRGRQVWLGLPGNPLATCTGWYYFARPVLTTICGIPPARKQMVECSTDLKKPEGLRCFYRGNLTEEGLKITPKQGSAHFSASIDSNTYVELPEGHSTIPAGTKLLALTP
ncbi:MAG: hypothetical protein RL011_318 [Pseudomonadota bacterium]